MGTLTRTLIRSPRQQREALSSTTGKIAKMNYSYTRIAQYLRGLAPYHWSNVANPFSWIPFSGLLEANREFSMLTFLRKCFWYGSAIWLLRATGWPFARSAVVVAMLQAAIEVLQIHLPGRVSEITDPVLTLILAATLGLLERIQHPHRGTTIG